MPASKKRRNSLNTRPSLIPEKARIQANGARVRRERLRDRQRLWENLGLQTEESWAQSASTVTALADVQSLGPFVGEPYGRDPGPEGVLSAGCFGNAVRQQTYPHTIESAPLPAEWPPEIEMQLDREPPAAFTSYNSEDRVRIGNERPPPRHSTPIQLLWTPHGIVSCNGKPIELHYPPNMTIPLPPIVPPQQDKVEDPRHFDADFDNEHAAFENAYLKLRHSPFAAHEKLGDSEAAPEMAISAAGPGQRATERETECLSFEDDLSESLQSFSLNEQAITDTLEPTQCAQTNGHPSKSSDLNAEITEAGPIVVPRDYHDDGHRGVLHEGNDEPASENRNPITDTRSPTSGAVQRSELDRGRQSSSSESQGRRQSGGLLGEGGDEPGDVALSSDVKIRLEPLLRRLGQRRPHPSETAHRRHLQNGSVSTPRRANAAPYPPRKTNTTHTQQSGAPAPHTPIFRSRMLVEHRLRGPDRRDQESAKRMNNASTSSADVDIDNSSITRTSTLHRLTETQEQETSHAEEPIDYGSEDELLLKPDNINAGRPHTMATEVTSSMCVLSGRLGHEGVGRVTPTLPPASVIAPYHKPGLHTLSQTIFKRRPEAWANFTYLQQPGTNSLDPKTPAPPTPTIAPVDVWLGVSEVEQPDKRLESIGEVPELEEIEVDEESESDEEPGSDDKVESIRSSPPSQEKPRKRQKKQVRFNLNHEEFFYEPEPDFRRFFTLLRAAEDFEQSAGFDTTVYGIEAGMSSIPLSVGEQPSAPTHETVKEEKEMSNPQSLSTSPAVPAPPSSEPGTATEMENNENNIGFTIYRDED